MPCPKCTSKRQFYSETWTHAGCGGDLYLDEDGIVHCAICGKKAHITKMNMICDVHKFFNPSIKQIASAVTTSKMCSQDNSTVWVVRLLKNL